MNTNTPANGNTTTPNNPKITLSQNTDNIKITSSQHTDTTPQSYPNVIPNNPKITVTTADNGKITASHTPTGAVKVLYTVHCKELGIFREFDDYPTAHTFATQLGQDYPQAHIEKAKVSLFFDDWDNGIITAQQGGNHERD